MAEGKKSFVLYSDLIHTVEKIDDKKAGQLFKHILRYVNDKNPKAPNMIVEISFESIKQQLKRDLLKWEEKAQRARENGIKGGRPPKTQKNPEKPSGLKNNPEEPRGTQRNPEKPVNVNVNDTVSVKGKERKEKKDFFPPKDFKDEQDNEPYRHPESEKFISRTKDRPPPADWAKELAGKVGETIHINRNYNDD